MGFVKRYITKETILNCSNHEQLNLLFKADALILDKWSSEFYKFYQVDKKLDLQKYIKICDNNIKYY